MRPRDSRTLLAVILAGGVVLVAAVAFWAVSRTAETSAGLAEAARPAVLAHHPDQREFCKWMGYSSAERTLEQFRADQARSSAHGTSKVGLLMWSSAAEHAPDHIRGDAMVLYRALYASAASGIPPPARTELTARRIDALADAYCS